MRERDLVRVLSERLRQEGAKVLAIRLGHERGADIEGILPYSGRRFFIEAKGVRKGGNERTAMGEALLQIFNHYDYDVVCGIAVPYSERFESLFRSIRPALAKLHIHGVLVRGEEVYYVPPLRDFVMENPESLVAQLDASG